MYDISHPSATGQCNKCYWAHANVNTMKKILNAKLNLGRYNTVIQRTVYLRYFTPTFKRLFQFFT